MNQGIAFSRTLRALDADGFRASKLGLLAALGVLAAWTWWMVAARVPQYQSTGNVRIESGHVLAYFPSVQRIHPGQRAVVRLDSAVFPAQVQAVASDHIELVLGPNPQSSIPDSSSASVDIEVARLSPASLALRSLGISAR